MELTLREFDALAERYHQGQEWLNYRAGLICSVFANVFRDSKQKAYTPQDFMPKTEPKRQTTEQMLNAVTMLNAAFGGRVLEN